MIVWYNIQNLRRVALESDFGIDKEARKNYLRLPRVVFFLTVLILPACGALALFLLPDIEGTDYAAVFAGFMVMPLISLPVAGGYLGYACSRSKTQRLSIRPDGYVSYYNHSGCGEHYLNNDMFYIMREVYSVNVTNRIIKVRFGSKLFPLQIPRTFCNDHEIIAQLEKLRNETKEQPPYIPLVILKGIFMVIKLPALIIASIFKSKNSVKVEGYLNGFEEKDGKHYPRMSFTTTEGQFMDRVDYECPIEDIVKDAVADRMLRKKYPKKITIEYSKNDPEKFTGLFI